MKSMLLTAIFVLSAILAAADPADLVFRNGTIITMEKEMPQASAIAIQGDRIAWVGESKHADAWISEKTKVIDLEGAFVYPGFIDTHVHVVGLGTQRIVIDLNETGTKDIVVGLVKDRVMKAKKGEWIFGRGWDQNLWPEKKFPAAKDLDAVSPENPVALERTDGHAFWVNSLALKLAGIDASTKDPDGGMIHRDEKGNPTGVLLDTADDYFEDRMGAGTEEEVRERTLIALQEAARKGVTMVHDAGTSGLSWDSWKRMADRGELPVRIYGMAWLPSDFGESFLKTGPVKHGTSLELRAIKLQIDGAMGSRGAAMLKPYADDPGNSGLIIWKDDELMRVLEAAKAKGIQTGIHAIGDRANRLVLNDYETLGVKGLRWRIEHAQLLAFSDIPRFAKIGVTAVMQPIHATADGPWATDRVGPERIKGAYAWRSLLDTGAIIAGGSDAPVEDINPLWGLYAAVTRRDHKGWPGPEGWLPEQKVTRQEALRMYTVDAAYASFHENELGSLEAGKWADLVVLPENVLTCDVEKLIDMKVLYTIVGGQIRYQR